jgi:hypothetical protein
MEYLLPRTSGKGTFWWNIAESLFLGRQRRSHTIIFLAINLMENNFGNYQYLLLIKLMITST